MQGPHFSLLENLPGSAPDPERWRVCEVTGFRQAEEILDLLERSGIEEREMVFFEGRVAVRWRQPVVV